MALAEHLQVEPIASHAPAWRELTRELERIMADHGIARDVAESMLWDVTGVLTGESHYYASNEAMVVDVNAGNDALSEASDGGFNAGKEEGEAWGQEILNLLRADMREDIATCVDGTTARTTWQDWLDNDDAWSIDGRTYRYR